MNYQNNEIYNKAIDGDGDAFERICVEIIPSLVNLQRSRCNKLGIPVDLAEDLVQEAYQRAIPHLREDNKIALPTHYINKTLLNVTKDFLRRRRLSRTQELSHDVAAPTRNLDTTIDVNEAFTRLDDSEKEILNLILIEGYTPSEAADKICISKWSAYKRYERALRRLRSFFVG